MGTRRPSTCPSKVTATELKRLEAEDAPPEDTGAPLLAGAPRTQTFRRPDFSARARKLTAAERGTATHRILQYLHFADARTPEGIRAQVESLSVRGQLTAREAQAVDTASLLRLGQTPLGAQLAAAEAAGTLRREFRFSLLCPAGDILPRRRGRAGAAAGRGGRVVRNKGRPRYRGL